MIKLNTNLCIKNYRYKKYQQYYFMYFAIVEGEKPVASAISSNV